MFIKTSSTTKNGKRYPYYQVVSSYRENGKIKHKRIANLGHLTEKDIDNLIKGLQRIRKKPFSLQEAKLKHKRTLIFGQIHVLDQLWQRFGISEILCDCAGDLDKVQFDIAPYIKLMTFFRLLNPGSELKLTEWFGRIYFPEIRVLEYHKLLRSLGYVVRIKDGIERKLLRNRRIYFIWK